MQNIYRVAGDLPGKCKLEFEKRIMTEWDEDEIVHESNIEMFLDQNFKRVCIVMANNRIIEFPMLHTNEITCVGYEFENEMFGMNIGRHYYIFTDE